jgi:RNA polymerase sigma-70 factor (ECF subfamily)
MVRSRAVPRVRCAWIVTDAASPDRRTRSVSDRRGAARKEGLGAADALDAVQETFQTFLLLPQARSLVGEPRESASLLGVVSVDEAIERAEEHVRLLGCVNRLAEMQRQVVRLRMLQELSGLETAEQLGLEPGRVAVLLHRAKKALLECLVS